MDGMLFLEGKKYRLNILQLIGSFVFVAGIVGIFVSISGLTADWNYMYTGLDDCYMKSTTYENEQMCRDHFYAETGVVIKPDSFYPNEAQRIVATFNPIITFLMWVAISLLGIFIFNSGRRLSQVLLPIDRVDTSRAIEVKVKKENKPKAKATAKKKVSKKKPVNKKK